jgi:biotin operon repressor
MLAEAAPDFVGLTDVAELTGMSRQNMRKLMHLRQFTDGGWQRIGAALA